MTLAYPDPLVGLDSHTTTINGLGVVSWGVGGIEAEAVMLGQPISILSQFEAYHINGITESLSPGKPLTVRARYDNGAERVFTVMTRIETPDKVAYYRYGGILQDVLRQLLNS